MIHNKFFAAIITLLCGAVSSMASPGDPEVNHFVIADTARNYLVNIRGQLVDSVAITNFDKFAGQGNMPTHYDNSMSIRLFLDGQFTEDFKFNARVKVSTDYTNRDIPFNYYNPNEGIPYNKQSESKRTWDLFAANASYQLSALKLLGGFDYLSMGPARHNHVILRGEQNNYRPWQDSSSRIYDAAPTPYFGYQFEIGPVVYSQYGMKLFEKKGEDKFLHVHRLDLNLPANVTLGLSETALYGTTVEAAGTNPNLDADSTDRDFEWAYMIPFVPYVFQEHLQGDQDNIGLAFDLSIKTIPHWEIYGELLWDDMKSPTSMFDDGWWGNKWAASVGIARDSLHLGKTIWNWYGEYTRIEPWVYTHHKGGGYTYASYSQSMGADLGPNSQEIYTELNGSYRIESGMMKDALIRGTLLASAVAKDTAFGGNITDIHGPDDATDKKFLNEKTTQEYYEVGGKLEFYPFCWMGIRAGYSRFFGDYEGYRATATGTLQW